MTVRQIEFEGLADDVDYTTLGIAHGNPRNTYATLKAVAGLLVPHNLELVIFETGGEIDFSIDSSGQMETQMLTEGDLRRDGDLLIAPDYCYDPDAYTPGDDPYARAEADQPLPALEEANRLLADRGLEIVMDEYGDWLIKIVKLGYSTVTPEFDDPFNGTVRRSRGPTEVSIAAPTMENLLRQAGVNPALASVIENQSAMSIPVSGGGDLAASEDGMRTFEKAVPLPEPDIEIDVDSLDLDEVIDLLKDRAIIGKARIQLHQRLDVLILS